MVVAGRQAGVGRSIGVQIQLLGQILTPAPGPVGLVPAAQICASDFIGAVTPREGKIFPYPERSSSCCPLCDGCSTGQPASSNAG